MGFQDDEVLSAVVRSPNIVSNKCKMQRQGSSRVMNLNVFFLRKEASFSVDQDGGTACWEAIFVA